MKLTISLLAIGLGALTLTGCQTDSRGPYDRGINQGPVGRSTVVVVQDPQPTYRDRRNAGRPYIAPRDYRNDRRDSPRGGYDRVRDNRDRCPGGSYYDARRGRCSR